MELVGHFFIGILLCGAIVSGEIRPLDPNNVQKFTIGNRADEQNYRLPNDTKPETYDITIKTTIDEAVDGDQTNFYFEGTVKINIKVLNDTNKITLHARQLTIKNIALKEGSTTIQTDPYEYQIVPEFVVIPTKDTLKKDKNYELTIEYLAELRTDNAGFYRSSYTDENGLKRWLATTQFESTDARHAFPCYDEPALKANFTIRIQHGGMYHAISNSNGTRKQLDEGRVETTFDTTPPTSTYLIAFIVSDFGKIVANVSETNPTYQQVFTSKNKLSQATLALEDGVNILNALSKYLSVPYTLSKMDQAAIPDFAAGAMENWGLVTYRETYLLYDPNVHLPSRKFTVSTTIAHEYGHQWFGDLVSPKWWSYIWLNEGFATLFEYLGAGLVHPEWNVFNAFVASEVQPVLRVDARPTTRAMTTYVESPNAVSALFDNIAYSKSGSVIRMFLHALGEETFKKGLRYYLTAQAYKDADENDLFENLDKAAKEDKTIADSLNVKDLFGSWSNQKGFPFLKVSRNDDGSLTLEQGEYNATYKKDEPTTRTWWIPFNFATRKVPEFNVTTPSGWFEKGQNQTHIPANNTLWTNNDWVIFNRQQTGFYRVWYDDRNYELVNNELNSNNFEIIHEINRAQYIDDLNELVNSGRVEVKTLFNALKYLKKETKYTPWAAARRIFNDLSQIFTASDELAKFNTYVAGLVQNFYKNKTLEAVENEPLFDKYSRNIAVELACRYGVKECLSDTHTKFYNFVWSGDKPKPESRGLVFVHGIRNATYKEIDKFWLYLIATPSADERKEAISSLANIQNATEIELRLNKTLENMGSQVTKSDRVSIVQSLSGGSQDGLSVTIKFLENRLDAVNTTIGSIPTILKSIASKIVTAKVQTEFFVLLELAKSKDLLSETEVKDLQDTVNERVEWQKTVIEKYEKALNSGAQSATLSTLLVVLFCLVRWAAE